VSPFLLLPLLLRWSGKKLSEPSSSLTWPRTRSTTFQPPSPPRAHRRRSSPRISTPSPWAAPSQPSPAKLSLPLESPASARAKPPSLGPRTGPPAASHRQASPAAGSSPSLGRFATPSGRDAVPPPFAGKWAHSNAVTLAAAPSPPRSWAAARPKALQRARSRPGRAKSRVPSPGKRNSLFFFFFPPLLPI
jgi:hypothetical protein